MGHSPIKICDKDNALNDSLQINASKWKILCIKRQFILSAVRVLPQLWLILCRPLQYFRDCSWYYVGRCSTPSYSVVYFVGRHDACANCGSTLSAVRVFPQLQQVLSRPREYSILQNLVLCRPLEYSIPQHRILCRPSRCLRKMRKHSVGRESIISNYFAKIFSLKTQNTLRGGLFHFGISLGNQLITQSKLTTIDKQARKTFFSFFFFYYFVWGTNKFRGLLLPYIIYKYIYIYINIYTAHAKFDKKEKKKKNF